jgi:hypothetical protein
VEARQRSAGAGLGLALVAALVVVAFLVLRPGSTNPVPPAPSSIPSTVALGSEPPGPTITATPTPTPTLEPVAAVAEDGVFRLEIAAPQADYTTTDAIRPSARLSYIGPKFAIVYGHASPAVYFTIQQLDGSAEMGGGADDLCELTTLPRDDPAVVPFAKAGQIGLGFDLAWFRDPVLRLPAGTWRIGVSFEGTIPACEIGSETHRLTAFQDIVVR